MILMKKKKKIKKEEEKKEELKNKLAAIRGVKNEVPVKEETLAEESVEVPSEEQLMAELKS